MQRPQIIYNYYTHEDQFMSTRNMATYEMECGGSLGTYSHNIQWFKTRSEDKHDIHFKLQRGI